MAGAFDPAAVDRFIGDRLLGGDPTIAAARAANQAAGLPPIDVPDPLGKLLMLLARAIGARHILEIGTLGGVSTIWLARGLTEDGDLVTLEIDRHHAEVARANLTAAGVSDRVDIRVGPARQHLQTMLEEGQGPFDLAFIDADKQSSIAYVEACSQLVRPGGLIVVDNVVREGAILDEGASDPRDAAIRELYGYVAAHPGLDATALQTVGAKKWDGFMLIEVSGRND